MAIAKETTPCPLCAADDSEAEAAGTDFVAHSCEDVFTVFRCRSCGLLYLNPRPASTAAEVIYPAAAVLIEEFEKGPLGRAKEALVLKRFERLADHPADGARVLDIGCGNGQFLQSLGRSPRAYRCFGLDLRIPDPVKMAFDASGIGYFETLLEDADLPDSSFDVIVMHQLIEHLWRPKACLANVARALKPGGRLIVTTPNFDGYDRRLFSRSAWGGYYFPRHLAIHNKSTLKRLLEEQGLEVVEQRDLIAPFIWAHSLQAWSELNFPKWTWLRRFVDVTNPLAAGAYVALDTIAMALGIATSNQAAAARRPL